MSKVLILQHTADVPAGSLTDIFERAGVATQTFRFFERVPDDLPLQQSSGLVVLGGPMSANDTEEFPFLAAELNWMRTAVDQGIPLLGICLGSQLLAKAMGGRVYPHTVREIGWYDVDLLPAVRDDALFGRRKPKETVFQWHGDTFELPPGAELLAQSPLCRNQAFRIGQTTYGVQFHAEMTPEIMHVWLAEKPAKIHDRLATPLDPVAIAAASTDRFPAMIDFSQAILSARAAVRRTKRFVVLAFGETASDKVAAIRILQSLLRYF